MEIFTVSLFGHRKLTNIHLLDKRLTVILQDILNSHPYVSFLIGRNGEFDEYAASVIKATQKRIGKEKSDLTLVLPYIVARISDYEHYYDNIIIPDCLYNAHPKSAITLKNRWMIEKSDLVIVYVEKNNGGAHTALSYAEKINKKIINLHTVS